MNPKRAHRWLELLVVGAFLVAAASVPVSAAANSAFDQYVEVPPQSGVETPEKPGEPGQNGGSDQTGTSSTAGAGNSDEMVLWATGQDSGGPGSSVSVGDNRSVQAPGSTGKQGNDAGSLTASNGIGNSLGSVTVDANSAPVPLILAMALAALGAIGLVIARKRQFD